GRLFAQSKQHRALHAANCGKVAGFIAPRLAQIAAIAHRRSEVERLLLLGQIPSTKGDDAAIGQLRNGIVYPDKSLAFAARAEVRLAMTWTERPGLSAVAADVQAYAGLVAVERQNEKTFACADRLIANLRLGLNHPRFAPCRAAVGGSAHDVT